MRKVALACQRAVLCVPEAYKHRGIPCTGGGPKTGEHGIREKRAIFSRIKNKRVIKMGMTFCPRHSYLSASLINQETFKIWAIDFMIRQAASCKQTRFFSSFCLTQVLFFIVLFCFFLIGLRSFHRFGFPCQVYYTLVLSDTGNLSIVCSDILLRAANYINATEKTIQYRHRESTRGGKEKLLSCTPGKVLPVILVS